MLRKIIAKTESNLVSINFYDHVYNEIFDIALVYRSNQTRVNQKGN